MKMSLIFGLPIKVIQEEKVTFSIWLILIILGSLAGLISLAGSDNQINSYILSGSFYITTISLASAYIFDTVIVLLDNHRKEGKTSDILPIQILLLIVFISMIFISSIYFKNLVNFTLEEKKHFLQNNNQILLYIFTILIGIYTYSVNRLQNYPKILILFKFIDKKEAKTESEDGEKL